MAAKSESIGSSESVNNYVSTLAPPAKGVPTGAEMGKKPVFDFDLNELPQEDSQQDLAAVEEAQGAFPGKRKIQEGESSHNSWVKKIKSNICNWLSKKKAPADQEEKQKSVKKQRKH